MKNNCAAEVIRILQNGVKPAVSTAFTLTEVLITLAIIGVVASLTIPSLIQNTQNQETVARLKKAYSTISAAYERAVVDNGSPEGWKWNGLGDGPGSVNALNILAPYLKITKNCGTSTGCFPPNLQYKYLNNTTELYNLLDGDVAAKAQLIDGSLIAIFALSGDCTETRGLSLSLNNVCGVLFLDVNGFKEPNQIGKDTFEFYITKYGVLPLGTSDETTYPPSSCDKTKKGSACTAWVIQKGNMDYLK